jgi:hypothetical protein
MSWKISWSISTRGKRFIGSKGGDENWALRGDTNSKFFQKFANGSRRKNLIKNLETDNGVFHSQEDIEKHVTSF